MVELEVEAVDEIDVPEGIDATEYVLFGGKGGVGKTTMAAATGLASARDDTPTLVVSTDPAHSLSDTFETVIPAEPTRIREDVPLFAVEIDPESALEEGDLFGGSGAFDDFDEGSERSGGDEEGPFGSLEDLLGDDGAMAPLLGGTMPGADEAAAMHQLLRYMDDPRFERVIVDTAPTGHTLRLLELPEMMDTMLGRMIRLRERFQGILSGMAGLFGGGDEPEAGADLDELRDSIERLRSTLRDPALTDFRIVMVPEEMSVLESKRLLSRLEEYRIPVGTVIVNRVMEPPESVADLDPDWFVSPNLEGCEFCQRRWKVQQRALTEAQDLFRGHDVKRVPLFADEVRGERMLRVVAACLE